MTARWLLALLLCLPVAAQDSSDARRAYAEGRFAAAHDAFRAIALEAGDRGSTELWFHAGNSAFRAGRFAEAAYAYRCALRRAPDDARLRFNLTFAERRLGLAPPTPPTLGTQIAAWFTRSTYSELALWITLGHAFSATILLLSRRRSGARAVATLGVVATLLGLIVIGIRSAEVDAQSGVILERHAQLRAQPHDSVEPEVALRPGSVVRVLRASDRWAQVQHDGAEGWIRRSELGLLQ